MANTGNDTPFINANFAMTVIKRAAETVAGATTTPGQGCDAFSAFQQARDEFKAGETRQQEKSRSYGWALLMRDVGQYIKIRHPIYEDSFTPIGDWSEATTPNVVAQTLREAATAIADLVAERTRAASKFEAMTPQEMAEYDLMWKAAAFLTRQGLTVNVAWDRENPDGPIDYRATVDGVEWAFELTELRMDAEGSHLTIGHPSERKTIREQPDQLVTKVPQIPDGPDALQQALDNAAKHGSKPSKLKDLNGVRYCLILHNRQFLYVPDWEKIAIPDLSAFDAVLALHQESFPPAQTWQVLRNGFGKPVRSQNVNDLGDIAAFRNSNRAHRIDAELVKSAWQQIEALGLTDDDIRAAITEARAKNSHR